MHTYGIIPVRRTITQRRTRYYSADWSYLFTDQDEK